MQEEVMEISVDILDAIFSSIDTESMQKSRRIAIWDEFKSKVKGSSLKSHNLATFVESICKKFNISFVRDYNIILDNEKYSAEILEIYRNELMMCIFKLRLRVDDRKEKYAKKKQKKSETAEYNEEMEELNNKFLEEMQ